MKKVVVISTSLRPGSNSHALAEQFAEGAKSAGNEVELRAESGLQGWIDCYEKSALKAHLFCGGVNDSREINGNPKLQEAFELGKNV